MRVELIDITNNPIEKIFKSYRICYSSNIYEEIASKSEEEMIKFIKPLMDEGHTSPLEHVSATFSIEGISRACLSQITRHRTGKFNVQSQRYVNGKYFYFIVPETDYLKNSNEFSDKLKSYLASKLDIENKTKKEIANELLEGFFEEARMVYGDLIKLGMRKEDARSILPMATTCNLVVTFDLNNFRKFLNQRLCIHAQKEIRELAKEMNKLVKEHVPFIDYKVLRCQQGLCKNCIDK